MFSVARSYCTELAAQVVGNTYNSTTSRDFLFNHLSKMSTVFDSK